MPDSLLLYKRRSLATGYVPLLLAFPNLTQQLLPLSHPKANGNFHSGVAGHKRGKSLTVTPCSLEVGMEEPLRGFLLKGNREHKIESLTRGKGKENLTKGLPFPFRSANFLAKWNENECAVDAGLQHCLLTQQHIWS